MTNKDQQRAAFEAWRKNKYPQFSVVSDAAIMARNAWQAAIAQDRQSRGEPFEALAELVKALRERHYGRMPDEVQAAYDRAFSIVFSAPQPAEPVKGPSDCPHAAPHRYCSECVVSPCPVGLGGKK